MTTYPELHVKSWAGTKRSLHLYAQMLGKIRVALSPPQPNWMYTPLYLNARGFTTGFIPYEQFSIEASLDVCDSRIVVEKSTGDRVTIDLVPARTAADVYEALSTALHILGVNATISTIPQEVPDTTPLDEDHRPSEYDPEAVKRWFSAATATAAEFERWRSHFFGRSGIQLWWGAFDLAVLLFSGRRVAPPTDRGFLMKYDLDAEMLNVGLYFGDESNPPFFYGYIYPEPAGAAGLAAKPNAASWSDQLHEWVLPYDAVRTSSDPAAAIRDFLDSIYRQCFGAAAWNVNACSYDAPAPARARKHELEGVR